ncbi:hypothetical protein [Nonlabens ponticola]|uniref:Isoleucyl-tRNA synthetase n=1 Tax=Nonlabens ponticola TaxID=2496866 RepID=A0A3S9MUU9_9FLAO|nr:hypothetical protein [Nonlabens ponticola]AZQ42951.1 hypothetical protein EJ995_01385 [Nonlabens ponticola]
MNATKIIGLLLFAALAVIAGGFYFINQGDALLGNKLIGFSTAFIFLILMPAFIVVRYRNKDLSKFNLNPPSKDEDEDDDWDDVSKLN